MNDDTKAVVAEALKEGLVATPVKEGNPGGILEAVPSWKVMGLSVGDAVKGAAAAGVGDVVVRLVLPRLPTNIGGTTGVNTTSAIAKAIAAFLLQSGPAKKFLGGNASNFGSLLLVIDAINDVVQVRTSVANLLGRLVSGFVPGSGLVFGGNQPKPVAPERVVAEAVQVADSYYAKAFGGK